LTGSFQYHMQCTCSDNLCSCRSMYSGEFR